MNGTDGRWMVFLVGLLCPIVLSAPASGQMWFSPDMPYPAATENPEWWVRGTAGRGLTDVSGELTTLGFGASRVGPNVDVGVAAGYVSEAGGEVTLGGQASLHTSGTHQIGLQAGVAWVTFETLRNARSLRFPIGVLVRTVQGEGALLVPWVMPKLTVVSLESSAGGGSLTQPGVAGGLWVTGRSGVGLHLALDVEFPDAGAAWLLGVGLHWSGDALAEVFR